MVVTLVLSALPRYVTLVDLATNLDQLLEREDIGSFHVRDLPNNPSNGKRRVALDFESGFDAMNAQVVLNGYKYEVVNDRQYTLKARVTADPELMRPANMSLAGSSSRLEGPGETALVPYDRRGLESAELPLDKQLKVLKAKLDLKKKERKLAKIKKKLEKEEKRLAELDRSSTSTSPPRKRKKSKKDKSKTRTRSPSPKTLELELRKKHAHESDSSCSSDSDVRRKKEKHRWSKTALSSSSERPLYKELKALRQSPHRRESSSEVPKQYRSSRSTERRLRSPPSKSMVPYKPQSSRTSSQSYSKDRRRSPSLRHSPSYRSSPGHSYTKSRSPAKESHKKRPSPYRSESRKSQDYPTMRSPYRASPKRHSASRERYISRSYRPRSPSPPRLSTFPDRYKEQIYIDRSAEARRQERPGTSRERTRGTELDQLGDNVWGDVDELLGQLPKCDDEDSDSSTTTQKINIRLTLKEKKESPMKTKDTIKIKQEKYDSPVPKIKKERSSDVESVSNNESPRNRHDSRDRNSPVRIKEERTTTYDYEEGYVSEEETVAIERDPVTGYGKWVPVGNLQRVIIHQSKISNNPKFVIPIANIMKKMKKHTADLNPDMWHKYEAVAKSVLRYRIKVLLKNKEYMSSSEIIKLYRAENPIENDKKLVDSLIEDIKAGVYDNFQGSDDECGKKYKKKRKENGNAVDDINKTIKTEPVGIPEGLTEPIRVKTEPEQNMESEDSSCLVVPNINKPITEIVTQQNTQVEQNVVSTEQVVTQRVKTEIPDARLLVKTERSKEINTSVTNNQQITVKPEPRVTTGTTDVQIDDDCVIVPTTLDDDVVIVNKQAPLIDITEAEKNGNAVDDINKTIKTEPVGIPEVLTEPIRVKTEPEQNMESEDSSCLEVVNINKPITEIVTQQNTQVEQNVVSTEQVVTQRVKTEIPDARLLVKTERSKEINTSVTNNQQITVKPEPRVTTGTTDVQIDDDCVIVPTTLDDDVVIVNKQAPLIDITEAEKNKKIKKEKKRDKKKERKERTKQKRDSTSDDCVIVVKSETDVSTSTNVNDKNETTAENTEQTTNINTPSSVTIDNIKSEPEVNKDLNIKEEPHEILENIPPLSESQSVDNINVGSNESSVLANNKSNLNIISTNALNKVKSEQTDTNESITTVVTTEPSNEVSNTDPNIKVEEVKKEPEEPMETIESIANYVSLVTEVITVD